MKRWKPDEGSRVRRVGLTVRDRHRRYIGRNTVIAGTAFRRVALASRSNVHCPSPWAARLMVGEDMWRRSGRTGGSCLLASLPQLRHSTDTPPVSIALTSILVLVCALLTIIGAPVARASVIQPRIDGGGAHLCILSTAGGVQCWGQNTSGQLGDGTYITKLTPTDVVGLGSGIAQVAAGSTHTCAVTTGGALKCWGDNTQHQLGDPGVGSSSSPLDVPGYGPGTVEQVATGGAQTCVLLATGGVDCWGSATLTPTAVTNLHAASVVQLVAGGSHACALFADKTMQCWGSNAIGQLGDGTTQTPPDPLTAVDVAEPAADFVQIGTGYNHTCAVTDVGRIKCWGENYNGQLGRAVGISGPQPDFVDNVPSGATQVVGGSDHTCAVVGGGVKCWGVGAGRLGNGTAEPQAAPGPVLGLTSGVMEIGTAYDTTCALTTIGALKCWGGNHFGQLGDGTTDHRAQPFDLLGLTDTVGDIATGYEHSCAVVNAGPNAGTVRCWGGNRLGALGDGTHLQRLTPTTSVSGLADVVQVSAGYYVTCALKSNGHVWCWGQGGRGQLGNGAFIDSDVPVEVQGLTDAEQISVGFDFTCALLTGGSVVCWGDDQFGRLGDDDGDPNGDRATPVSVLLAGPAQQISAGGGHACALLVSGVAQCWGWNGFGQLGIDSTVDSPTPADVHGSGNFIAIAAGRAFTCAITTAGAVECWGQNGVGQLGNNTPGDRHTPYPVDTTNMPGTVQQVVAGSDHACALTNGAVKCWGYNEYGPLGDGTTTTRTAPTDVVGLSGVQKLAARTYHTCAITISDHVTCWGTNWKGEIGDGHAGDRATPGNVTGFESPVAHALTVTKAGSGGGAVTSSPSGIDCGTVCSADFAEGIVVTLSAAPGAGSTFDGWNGAACSGTGTCVVTMSTARSVTASFSSLPPGVRFSDDFEGTALDPARWNTSLATSGARWCASTQANHLTVSGLWQDVSSQACHGLVAAPPHGAVSVNGGAASFSAGSRRTFPYVWRGGPNQPSTFPATGGFTLDVRMRFDSLAGSGTEFHVGDWPNADPVGDNPPGNLVFSIGACSACGLVVNLLGTQAAVPGSPTAYHDYRLELVNGSYSVWVDGVRVLGPVASAARPNALWMGNPVFTHWGSGDWTDFTLDSVQVADVSAVTYQLDVTKAGAGGGTVTSTPAGINCDPTCSASFDGGTQVTLAAAANANATFSGWSGAGCSGTADCVVTMDQARSVMATFTPSATPLEVSNIVELAGSVGRFERFEADISLSRSYVDPFDSDAIKVDVTFTAPSGATSSMPAFWFQDFEVRAGTETFEVYDPVGNPGWRVRFAPAEVGTYSYVVHAVDGQGGSADSAPMTFDVTPTGNQGFVRVDANDERFFRFDRGAPYVPLGHNAAFDGANPPLNGTNYYEALFDDSFAPQENWTRIWMTDFNRSALEWGPEHWSGFYHGAGTYSMPAAWRMDQILGSAEAHGLYVQLVLNDHGQFSSRPGDRWPVRCNDPSDGCTPGEPGYDPGNPYSDAVGGPVPADSPEEFFSNAQARALFERRLRYVVARWGGYTNVLAWELFNEVQFVGSDAHNPYNDPAMWTDVLDWHEEMASFLASIDPNDHLVTTSSDPAPPARANLGSVQGIDIVQVHDYTEPSEARDPSIAGFASQLQAQHGKPVIIGEFGVGGTNPEAGFDPTTFSGTAADREHLSEGTNLHNAVWTGALSASGSMTWWWDNYMAADPSLNRVVPDFPLAPRVFPAIDAYLNGEDWAALDLDHSALTASSDVFAVGLNNDDRAFLWARDIDNEFGTGAPPGDQAGRVVSGATVEIPGMGSGGYRVTVFDTYGNGGAIQSFSATASGGLLHIDLPDFTRDVALKIQPANTHVLSVTKAGTGGGTVSSTPAGIDCGPTCSASFDDGTSVTLTATANANANATFTGWSGAGCSGTGTCVVTMDQARSVTATFTRNTHVLTVTKAGTGGGTVSSTPAGIDCGPTCSASFDDGTSVTLTATANANATFTGWSGAGCSGTGTCVVTMDQARSVTATFTRNTHVLSVTKAGTGGGTVELDTAGIRLRSDLLGELRRRLLGHAHRHRERECDVHRLVRRRVLGDRHLRRHDGSGPLGHGHVHAQHPRPQRHEGRHRRWHRELDPAGIDCGPTCSASFDDGTSVTLTATANADATFTGWSAAGARGPAPASSRWIRPARSPRRSRCSPARTPPPPPSRSCRPRSGLVCRRRLHPG